MSILASPPVAAVLARALQRLADATADRAIERDRRRHGASFPEHQAPTHELTIPTSVSPARAVVYTPADPDPRPPVHVNFHGGGYILRQIKLDDALCRYLAVEAGAVVVNVDYAVAPQHPFPAPPRQAFEVVQWVAAHGEEHGWDGGRLTVGGQSAGGGLAAAVARQAWAQGGPPIALQVLHYPPLDLATRAKDKRAAIARPMLRPWMAEIFDSAYVPDRSERLDPLASPANPADTADLTGIAPALVITPEFDLLHAEGERYAQRLRGVGALVEHRDVVGADHGYDLKDARNAGEMYALIAHHIKQAVA